MITQYLYGHWVLPVDRPPIAQGFIAIQGSRIEAVGSIGDLPPLLQQAADVQLQSVQGIRLITPGLVNTHAHLELTFDRPPIPIRAGETMADWLAQVIALSREHSSEKAIEERCQAGILAMARTGTTCIADISRLGNSLKPLADSGLRGIVAQEIIQLEENEASTHQALQTYLEVFQPYLSHPRVKPGLSPHASYTIHPAVWKTLVARLKTLKASPVLIHHHLAETRDELQWIQGNPSNLEAFHQRFFGKVIPRFPTSSGQPSLQLQVSHGPFEAYLQTHELLSLEIPLLIAHGSYLTEAETESLLQQGVGLAHCPRSNQFMHQHSWSSAWSTPKRSLWHCPHAIGLGTDSCHSVPDLDLRNEIRAALILHSGSMDDNEDVEIGLYHATLGGAKALGLEGVIGSLTPKKQADIAIWHYPTLLPTPSVQTLPAPLWLDCNSFLASLWVDGDLIEIK